MSTEQRIRRARRRFHRWVEKRRQKLAHRIKRRRKALRALVAELEQADVKPLHMYDSIVLDEIPVFAEAVAGYTNGAWPTFPHLRERWPDAELLSIAVTSSGSGRCLDVEPGDAEPGDAPAWLERTLRERQDVPVIYTMLSKAQLVVDTLAAAGFKQGKHYLLWTAHYIGEAHLCDHRCGFGLETKADGTQFTDKALGRNLDESVCAPHFFDLKG